MSQNKIRNPNLKETLDQVREFIKLLHSSTRILPDIFQFELSFSRNQEGTINLSGIEAAKYRECLDKLTLAVSKPEQVSKNAIEKALKDSIFTALDFSQQRGGNFSDRLDDAIKQLKEYLTRQPNNYMTFMKVYGLSMEGLPIKVGNVEFVVFDATQVNRFREAVQQHRVDEAGKRERLQLLEELENDESIKNCVVGIVEMNASDWEAAKFLALREVRQTIDIINFYSDLIPYNKGWIRLVGDREPARLTIPQLKFEENDWKSFYIDRQRVGTLQNLSLKHLCEYDTEVNMGFKYVTSLLSKKRERLEDQILTSLQWAGRATVNSQTENAFNSQTENAFLLYAIALESLILADEDRSELTYRLRLRVAHLLGQNLEDRRKIFNSVNDAYSIRSKIVHSGRVQVTDTDLALIRQLTKRTLIHICQSPEFQQMKTPDDMKNWFQDKLLGVAEPGDESISESQSGTIGDLQNHPANQQR